MEKGGLIPLRLYYYTVWRKGIARKGFQCSVRAFIMGRSGVGFALWAPIITWARGVCFVPSPCLTPVLGLTILIHWKGLFFSPPKYYGGLSGAWLGQALGRWQERRIGKHLPRPRPVSWQGWGILPGGCILWSPRGPVMSTGAVSFDTAGWRTSCEVYFFSGSQSFLNKCYIEISANSVNI